ncbi:hypothetical protein AX15_002814 [Amanita polypyramis BW_CC]|nr:hypothetical protein AX15_002814 [Amanita polypyramis BW_CC]
MSVRRPVPPPPPRRVHGEAAATTKRTSIADRIATLTLSADPGPPPPIPYHTRPTPGQPPRSLARRPPPPPVNPSQRAPTADPDPQLPRRRVPPLPSPLPTPPPEPAPEPEPEPEPSHEQPGTSTQDNDDNDGACIECYDFSAVDAHAAHFPRQTVTSFDDLVYALTSPFPSETEKARTIFTWLHYNIAYDAVSFLSGNVRSQSPTETLFSGLAVCDGYAGLFCDLAQRAGLQALRVGGHGKGYGYQTLTPGQSVPPYQGNHAWNCVLMDGEWRLIDSCWGAGYLNGSTYTQSFTPHCFTSSPVEFGKKHYPDDPSYQLLSEEDGGPVSWEDYILAPEGPQLFKDFGTVHLSPTFLQPATKYLARGQPASFHLFKRCQHMSTAEKDNYVYFLHHENSQIPLQRNAEGGWNVTIPIVRGDVKLCYLQMLNNRDAKGVTVQQFVSSIGLRAMSWAGLAAWTVI